MRWSKGSREGLKLAVIGSRTFDNYVLLCEALRRYSIKEIVSGGARGTDRLAERYVEEKGIVITIFRPDYIRYGRKAPLVRNKQIVDSADEVVAFWDKKSPGTKFTINYAREKGKKVHVIYSQKKQGDRDLFRF